MTGMTAHRDVLPRVVPFSLAPFGGEVTVRGLLQDRSQLAQKAAPSIDRDYLQKRERSPVVKQGM